MMYKLYTLLLFSTILLFSNNSLASRTINSATVDGSSSTSVSSGASITASVNVTTTGGDDDDDDDSSLDNWESTGWRIGSGPYTCSNHSDVTSAGTSSKSFNITAPVADGTYIVYFIAYSDDTCSSGASSEYILTNAVIVGSGTSACATFRDQFSSTSYSRQDGTATWSTNWNEVSDDNNSSSGDIEISNNKLQLEGDGSGSTALGAPYIEREADLSSYTTATLSFDYSESGTWESDDKIEIYASSDGGSNWNLIHTFTDDQGSTPQQFSQDISAYIASNTRIAFVEKASSDSERFFFDNVQIEACIDPDTPVVNSLNTTNKRPVLTGTFNSSDSAGGFTVEVNNVTYTLGSSAELTNSGDDWTLDLSGTTPLSLGTYEVVATADDGAGTVLSDNTSNELTIEDNLICVTFLDQFSSTSYSRQDGTANWSTDWNEVGDNGAVSSGDIEILSNVLQFEAEGSGPTILGAPYIERQADLSSYTTATLSFDYYETGTWESDDDIEIYVSSNGGSTWNLIHTFTDDQGSSTQQFSQDISTYIASNTRIAFVEKANSESERFFFDNVQIEACFDPDTPVVHSLNTTNRRPVLTGTFNSSDSAGGFTVEVNNVTYTLGSSAELTNSEDDWTLDLSSIPRLPIGTYDVVATADDGAGTVLSDTTSNELTIEEILSCVTFRDEFSTASYSQQDGTANWSTSWDEYEGTSATIPEASPNPASGHVRIVGGQLVLNNYSPETQNFPGVERELDLSSYTSATFSFDFVTSGGVSTSDSVVIMASANGGTNWTILEDITGINDTSGSKSYDLTPYISSNTKIRIRINNETVSGLGSECCYGGESETFSVDNVQIEACAVVGGGDIATDFNCVENNANGISGKLFTKTTAQSFSFDIVALQDASTIETNFANGTYHTVTVELVNAETVASCGSYPVLSPAVSQNLTMVSTDAGIKASSNMTSSTAYSTVKCRVTDATDSPSVVGCSTDSFAIRPSTYSVTSSNLLQTTTPTASATPATKAGETFSLEFSEYTDKPNKIDDTKITDHSGAISGVLSGTLADSQFTGDFTYSEVGWFLLDTNAIYDDFFTAVDQPDDCTNNFSNTPDVNGKVGCKFGNTANPNYFGRFIPDHFEITGSQNGVFSDACTGFTYTGQTFSYQINPTLTVTTYNGLGAVTTNYTGSYRKLSATDFDVTTPITDTTQMGTDGSNLVNLQWTPGTPALADNGDGSLTFTFGADDYIYQHEGNSKIVPFTPTVDLEFTDITDSESVPTQGLPHVIQASGTSLRFGRLSIDNVHGSELLPLALQLTTEYYDGSNYIKNTADSCTSFALATDFSISDPADLNCSLASNTSPVSIGSTGQVKAVMANTTASNGVTEITVGDNTDVTKGPGAGNTGYVEITSNLLTNLPWLRFNWDDTGSAYDDCPSARATFGIFKGNEQQIYFREVY